MGSSGSSSEVIPIYSKNPNYIEPTDNNVGVAGGNTPTGTIPGRGSYAAGAGETTADLLFPDEGKVKEANGLWDNKFLAADQAANDINAQIQEEASNASLHGTDYSIDEGTKLQRINGRFADLWSAENEKNLIDLSNKYGVIRDWTSGITRDGTQTTAGESGASRKEAGGKVKSGGTGSLLVGDALGPKKDLLGD